MNLETHIRTELWLAISNAYEAKNYNHAIVDAMHHLSNLLREKSGADGDGVSLVGQALGGSSPRLRVNKLQTETERNVQKGLEQILRGLYQAVRNPRSHEQIEDTKDTADAVIYFVSYLLGILDESEEPFTIPKFLARVLDPDFVESDHYAHLLAAQIPAKKRTDTIIEIYRKKCEGDGKKLKYIVKAILKQLSQDQIKEFLAVVSEELATTSDDAPIRLTLQVMPPHLWAQIDEVARLRIENKLIKSIEVGVYDPREDRTHQGALGTWALRFLPYFQPNTELSKALLARLESDSRWERSYVARYFMGALPQVFFRSHERDRCIRAICSAVRAHEDDYMKNQLVSHFGVFPSEWRKAVLENLKESDPEFYKQLEGRIYEEEIPF